VRRVVLKTPAGEIELEKKDTNWEILKPLRAAQMIRKLTT
jgi:hypothetical protein